MTRINLKENILKIESYFKMEWTVISLSLQVGAVVFDRKLEWVIFFFFLGKVPY